MFNTIFFNYFPYVALTLAVAVGLYRYFSDRFSFSSVSSQFLESKKLFWGSVPWHYGIIIILAGHVIGLAIPGNLRVFFGVPLRLYILETSALIFGLFTLFGLVMLIYRRFTKSKVRSVTSRMDVILLIMLLFQVATGIFIALSYRWGIAWYTTNAAPWIRSMVKLQPQGDIYMGDLPLMVKLHAINAFALIAVYPFTRLVHIATVPLGYFWRPYQVVIWARKRV